MCPIRVVNMQLFWLKNLRKTQNHCIIDSNLGEPSMEFKVEAGKRNKKFIEALMPSIIEQLKLERTTKVVVIRVADECGTNQGATVDLGINLGYVIVIKPTRSLKDLGITLAHEMVHVKQMAKGILKSTKSGAHIWAGKKYSKRTKYLDRPWEIEAFSKQELILRRAFEE